MKTQWDLITVAAKCGALTKTQRAFFYALRHYQETGELPEGKDIPPALLKSQGVRVSTPTAFRGLQDARQAIFLMP